jgi:hypothetical protein
MYPQHDDNNNDDDDDDKLRIKWVKLKILSHTAKIQAKQKFRPIQS